jgi:hypothetical protein
MLSACFLLSSRISAMRLRYLLPLACFWLSNTWADFSESTMQLHPVFPADEPFILEIRGNWPSDCHPGEQRPVVRSYDARSVLVEFDMVVIHVTCNDVITPYRVLVDLSHAVRDGGFADEALDIVVDFDGVRMQQTLPLVCPQSTEDCALLAGDQQRPLPGVYHAPGWDKQGILVARQNTGMAIYPLSYDEFGEPEWLISGNHLREDSFFAKLSRWSGGECFGCEQTETNPVKETVGYMTVLIDGPSTLQLKLDDSDFRQYQSLVYGYQQFSVGVDGGQTLIDLEGRWGISENRGTNPPLGDLTEFLPGAFDLELEHIITADNTIQQDGQVSYLLTTLTGDPLGQVICSGQTATDGITPKCEFIDPTDAAEPLLLFYQEGPSVLSLEYGRSVIAVGQAPGGKALRLD